MQQQTTFTDTSLLALQTRATSLSGKGCYELTGDECKAIIAEHDARDVTLEFRTLETSFMQVFG